MKSNLRIARSLEYFDQQIAYLKCQLPETIPFAPTLLGSSRYMKPDRHRLARIQVRDECFFVT